jgi:hypothetical protein
MSRGKEPEKKQEFGIVLPKEQYISLAKQMIEGSQRLIEIARENPSPVSIVKTYDLYGNPNTEVIVRDELIAKHQATIDRWRKTAKDSYGVDL